jgi:predicted deacylase
MTTVDRSTLFFKSHTYQAIPAGPKLIISGAVHGTETCGTIALNRFMQELERGEHVLLRGLLTIVPVVNPLAYAQGTREGDRNLNRNLAPTETPTQFEDHVANWFCPLVARHEILLDLHSFRSQGTAFVMVGPSNNDGPLERQKHAAIEEAIATRLGVNRFVHGWLSTYDKGVARRLKAINDAQLTVDPVLKAQMHTKYGVGTTEYMRSTGGAALTLECGQNQDPHSPEVAYQAIVNTLRYLGMIAGDAPAADRTMQALEIYEVFDKYHLEDHFVKTWASFDALRKGDLIATRHDGSELRAEFDGCIIFPDASAPLFKEWFYLAKQSDRLA